MKITRHRLHRQAGDSVPYVPSPNRGGKIEPTYLVMHYTAGRSAESSIRTLTNPAAKASAHLVIGRDGNVTQLVPFDRAAWHAGQSRWHGTVGLNNHSIGIELDNAGALDRQGNVWRSWFGAAYPNEEVLVASHKHQEEERGWHIYTEAQLAAAVEAAVTIVDHYDLRDVLGHDDIAPERKLDPGPAFPMRSFRASVLGRAEDQPREYMTLTELNIREGPGTDFEKLAASPLAKGTKLRLQGRESGWCFVEVLDREGTATLTGWVYGYYIAPA